jgi:hypothetical protein
MVSNRIRTTVSLKPIHTLWLNWYSNLTLSKMLQQEIDKRIAEVVEPAKFEKQVEFFCERDSSVDELGDRFSDYEEFDSELQEVIKQS